MKAAKVVCLLVIVVLAIQMYAAFSTMGVTAGSDVFYTGYARNAWQAFINTDLMAGLVLLSCWIIFREQRLAISIPLVFILLYWGNIVAATYAYSALHRADGDWERFFLGERKPGERPQQTAAVPVSRLKRALFYVGALACAAYAAWGMRRADFARYTVIGYLWGFVPIVAALLVAAHRKKTVNPT